MTIHAPSGNMYGLPAEDHSAAWAKIRAVEARRAVALDSRARSYAGKWRADEHTEEPTDEALAAAFRRCVVPAKPETYPQIRAHIANWSDES